jgi:hypothetical protein
LERISFEFNQLKNSLSICSGDNQDNMAQNNDINKLSQMLEKIMHDLFLKCMNRPDTDNSLSPLSTTIKLATSLEDQAENRQQLKHVLKSYALLSKQRSAELLFTEYLVKPHMEKVNNFLACNY